MTFRMGENKTEIDFVLTKKEHRWFIQNVKAIPGEIQHVLVIADRDKRHNKQCSEKDRHREKRDKFAERCNDQEAI